MSLNWFEKFEDGLLIAYFALGFMAILPIVVGSFNSVKFVNNLIILEKTKNKGRN